VWMDRCQVGEAWLLAPAFAAAGVDVDWCARVAAAVDSDALEPALQWVASAVAARGLLDELKESTRRISELVGAVRSYSQMDRASMQRIDVAEGLDSTLVMLGHKTGPDVA